MGVSFFSPIHSCTCNSSEKWGLFRESTKIFNFGQESYRIKAINGDPKLYVEKMKDSAPGFLGVVLRIILIATVIIPVIALAMMAIYRAANTFEIEKTEKPDPKKEKLPVPTKNALMLQAIVEGLKAAESIADHEKASDALCHIGTILILIDKERSDQVFDKAIERAGLVSELCLNKAKLAKAGKWNIEVPPMAKEKVPQALELAERAKGFQKFIIFEKIIKATSDEPQEALKFAGQAVDFIDQLEENDKNNARKRIIECFFAQFDRERALELAEAIVNDDQLKGAAYASVAKEFAKSDLEGAINWAMGLDDTVVKVCALCEVAKASGSAKKGIPLVEMAVEIAEGKQLILCAETMAAWDLKKARALVEAIETKAQALIEALPESENHEMRARIVAAQMVQKHTQIAEALTKVIKVCASAHPRSTVKLVSQVFKVAEAEGLPEIERAQIYLNLTKALV